MRTRARITLALFLALAAGPLQAQKTFISQCAGSAILLKAGGTAIKALGYYPVGFGDIVATGNDGSAELGTNGGFRMTLAPGTVVTYVHSGPLASARAVIELIEGTATFSDSGNGEYSPAIWVDGLETRAAPEERTATVRIDGPRGLASRAAPIAAELTGLEARYERETARLNGVNAKFRDLLSAGTDGEIAAYRAEELFPAQDARSAVIGEIARLNARRRAMRLFVLAPWYMRAKTRRDGGGDEALLAAYGELSRALGDGREAITP